MFPAQIIEAGYGLREVSSSVGASVGTATHAAVASCLTEKMKSGSLGNQTEDEQVGVASLEENVKMGVSWDQTTPNLSTGAKQVIRMYRAYRFSTAENVNPHAVERRLEFKTKSGNMLSGQVDISDEGVRDLKTGVTARSNGAQYGAYSLLARMSGEAVSRIVEDYIARVDINKDQPFPVEVPYDVRLSERVAAHAIEDVERKYERFIAEGENLVFSANPNSVLCGDRFCPAWGTTWCQEHRK